MSYDARLENWTEVNQDSRGFQLRGIIFDDKHKRWPNGEAIQTSLVSFRHIAEGDRVETRNSTYLLGRKG
jgi:hypothetical protein